LARQAQDDLCLSGVAFDVALPHISQKLAHVAQTVETVIQAYSDTAVVLDAISSAVDGGPHPSLVARSVDNVVDGLLDDEKTLWRVGGSSCAGVCSGKSSGSGSPPATGNQRELAGVVEQVRRGVLRGLTAQTVSSAT
jgi:hypothetical protein